jgi:hypothetical protein
MAQQEARYRYWRVALQAALVVGGVYTLFNVGRHWLAIHAFNSDLLYIGGTSFAVCTVPVFLIGWILLALFGKSLMPTSTE